MTRYTFWIPLAVILMMACTAAQVSELEQDVNFGLTVAGDLSNLLPPSADVFLKKLQTDFPVLTTVYTQVKGDLSSGVNLASLTKAFNDVAGDKVELEAVAQVSDPETQAAITKYLDEIDQDLANIAAKIPDTVIASLSPKEQLAITKAKMPLKHHANGKSAKQMLKEHKAYKKAHPLKATK